MAKINYSWQYGPSELIDHAIEHMHLSTDSDRRIAFLLLDVGVETLLKTFLTLPETVTHTTLKFSDRATAAKGNFHNVIEGIKKAAPSGKLFGINLDEVEFYHGKRNTLYHDGNGITIPVDLMEKYAAVAVVLLKNLLDVDLSLELNLPKKLEASRTKEKELNLEITNKTKSLHEAMNTLFTDYTLLAIESLAPKIALPGFKRSLRNIENSYLEGGTYMDEHGNEMSMYHIKDPDMYLLDIINLTKNAVENIDLQIKLFENEPKTSFLKDLELEMALSNFLSYEDLVVTIVKHGASKKLGWSRSEWMTPLEYLTSQVDFEDVESRQKSFLSSFEKITEDIQQTQKRYENWLAKN